jgi:hypothetical protein
MAAQTEKVAPDTAQSRIRSIELLTENGYGILRLSEIEGTSASDNRRHEFLITSPDGFQQSVVVEIQSDLVMQIQLRTRGRILLANSFWIYCAERHLADYIWEHEELPSDGKLLVDQLTVRDLNVSIRWETT